AAGLISPGRGPVGGAERVEAPGERADEALALGDDRLDPGCDHLVVEVPEPLPFVRPLDVFCGIAGALGILVEGRPGVLDRRLQEKGAPGGKHHGKRDRRNRGRSYTKSGATSGLSRLRSRRSWLRRPSRRSRG